MYLAQGRLTEAEQELFSARKVALRVGNPTQLWKTYVVIGKLTQMQDRPNDACRAYANALAVIDKVAAGLKDKTLRDMFMRSNHVQEIRQKV